MSYLLHADYAADETSRTFLLAQKCLERSNRRRFDQTFPALNLRAKP